jgi:hypothetical protein
MSNQSTTTDVRTFFEDLYGGAFMEKVGMALSAVSAGVVEHGRKGKVSITFDISRIADSQQVHISHTISMLAPTLRGEKSEKDTTQTPMHVNRGGRLSLFPENQGQLFNKDGSTNTTRNEV